MAAWQRSTDDALAAVRSSRLGQVVHLSFGDVPAEEYLWQLTTDALVHTRDLARATGQPEQLPDDLVEGCGHWFDSAEDAYRTVGAIGPAVQTTGGDPQQLLLGRFGRRPSADDPLAPWSASTARSRPMTSTPSQPPSATTAASSTPPRRTASSTRPRRRAAAFGELLDSTPSATFEVEGGTVSGDRVVVQWRYDWQERGGGHVRGIDLFTVVAGRVAEKHSYVKG